MKYFKLTILLAIIGLSAIALVNRAQAATEFVSIIDTGASYNRDYSSLTAWQTAVKCDLSTSTTLVFPYNPNTASGTLPDNIWVIGETSSASGTLVHMTATSASHQILIKGIRGTFQDGEKITIAASSSYYVYASSTGDSAIAVAKCRASAGAADTGAVTITGWTTSAANHVKIWTDPDDPYGRHQGKWDDTKYRLETTLNSIDIQADFVKIDGLQVDISATTLNRRAIMISSVNTSNSIELANNIITGISTADGIIYGIHHNDSDANSLIYNNIIYGFVRLIYGGSYGITGTALNSTYAYNNTVMQCDFGIQLNASGTYKNNLAYDCDDNYSGTGGGNSANNLSGPGSDASMPTNGARNGYTPVFADLPNDDFHLLPTDTAALNYGTSTFFDISLPFSTDIDGTARGAAFDIGADELPVEFVSTICQATSTGGDCAEMVFSRLYDWEVRVESDITSSATRVFSGYRTGNLTYGGLVTLVYPPSSTTTVTGYIVATTSDQILIRNIVSSSTPLTLTASGTRWFYSAGNYWSISTTTEVSSQDGWGASPIAVAKIDGVWSASDTQSVSIDGWTTDNDNYIKIYTAPLARHSGKWSNLAYRFYGSNYIRENFVTIDGLQIVLIVPDGDTGNQYAILIQNLTAGGSNVEISNNIIRGSVGSGDSGRAWGVYAYQPEVTWKLYNNVIYNFTQATSSKECQAIINFGGSTIYGYNNTLYNNKIGIETNSAIGNYFINNLIASTTDPFNGTFSSGTDYNATDKNDTPGVGTHNATSAVFSFVSTTTGAEDFHLKSTDSGARDRGFDITSSSTLDVISGITTDSDGQARPFNGTWDIGADEYVPKERYRSVGNTSADLKNAATVTISDITATFSAGQPDNVGVGDVLQYGGTGYYQLAFITGRTSSTTYSVQAWDGQTPTATTTAAVSIYRAFMELDDWEDNLEATVNPGISDTVDQNVVVAMDLVASNTTMMVPCYASTTADDDAVTIDGWTTGPQNYIKVYTPVNTDEVGVSQRHTGKWDESKFTIKFSALNIYITIKANYFRIEGLQIGCNFSGNYCVFMTPQATSSEIVVENNIVNGFNIARYGIRGDVPNPGMFKILNNIIFGFGYADGIPLLPRLGTYYIYNNTLANSTYGFIVNEAMTDSVYFDNNIAVNNIIGDYISLNSSSVKSANNNLSSDASADDKAGSTGNKINQIIQFVDAANDDFHLSPDDTAALDAGTSSVAETLQCNVSTSGCTDIDGQPIHTYDIGADDGAQYFVSTVKQSGGDFSTLATWENANDGLGDIDLTATTTLVFNCSSSDGVVSAGTYMYGETSGASGTATVLSTTSNQILLYNIKASSTTSGFFQSGEKIYVQGASPAVNYCITSNAGNPAIAVAKIDGAWTSPDTAAFSVTGWTTGPYNYIKIYTTPAARHQGKWDETKYRLDIANYYIIYIHEGYTRIDGVQFRLTIGGITWPSAILFTANEDSDMRISNNIIRADLNGLLNSGYGIASAYVAQNGKIWNNIIHDWSNGSGSTDYGINLPGSNQNWEVYNNTMYNCEIGIGVTNANVAAKNNISYNNTFNDYFGSFNASSTNNLSSDATAPAYGEYYRNASVQFVDAANDDFHLATEDTAAKNAGVELSSEASELSSLEYDIDGQARYDTGWDIGADEAPTIIYRSVGNDTSNLNPDNYTVTIAAATSTVSATFAGDLPANVGVGDVIQYGAPLQLAMIMGRVSSSTYYVQSATGSIPVATTTASAAVYRAHQYLENWEAQTVAKVNSGINDSVDDYVLVNQNLTATNTAVFVPCYASTSADNLAVSIDGWTTAAINYVKIYTPVNADEVGISQRHAGLWNDTKYLLEDSNNDTLLIQDEFTKIEGLQIRKYSSSDYHRGFHIANLNPDNKTVVSHNIIKGEFSDFSNFGYGILVNHASATTEIYNNIVYGWINGTSTNMAGIMLNIASSSKVYNNTVSENYFGIWVLAGSANEYIANNASFNNTFDFDGAATSLDYNASDDLDGTNAIDISPAGFSTEADAWVAAFVDYANYDFRIRSMSSVLYDAGTALSEVTTDIIGTARPRGNAYDVGAFEYGGNVPKYQFNGGMFQMRGKAQFR